MIHRAGKSYPGTFRDCRAPAFHSWPSMNVERSATPTSTVDILDRVPDKGIVIDVRLRDEHPVERISMVTRKPGKLVAFSATTAHMPDIGGRVRAIEARELFEEGFHIPLAKLVHAAGAMTRSSSSSAPTCVRPTRPSATSGRRRAPTS